MGPALARAAIRCLSAAVLAGAATAALGDDVPPLSRQVVGGAFEYTIRPGDFLIAIGARFGVPPRLLARQNAIPYDATIHPGRRLRIDNPHVVPSALDDGIVINIPQRMLFDFKAGRLVAAYPVGLGRPSWPTPPGDFEVVSRIQNKTWIVPRSIQEEMLREGRAVLTEVPPGPDNPLGAHWLGLSIPGYGIHGTIAPSSVYDFRSHGCIRLHPDDIAELFGHTEVGTPGLLIYQPVLLAVTDDGRILLEVHPDVYGRGLDPKETVVGIAQAYGLAHALEMPRVESVIAAREGLAREVGHLGRDELKGLP